MIQHSKDDQKLWLTKNLYFKAPDELEIREWSTLKETFDIHTAYEQIFHFKSGGKYFLTPKVIKFSTEFDQQNQDRKLPYVFDFPYKKTDTTVYNLGSYFDVESIPKKAVLRNNYAEYALDIQYNPVEKTITTIASLQIKSIVVPPQKYKELSDFFIEMEQMENNKIVIKKL